MLDTPAPETAPADPIDYNSPERIEAFAKKMRDAIVPSTTVDGWNAAKQRRFLEAVAEGETVTDACRHVGLSPQSAYAFRRRAKGRAFDLGWKGADLLARERVAANLMLRSLEGQQVTITRADGSEVIKHQYDNRLAVQMLNRLDRYADASERTAPGHAARLVAADFDSFLDVIDENGGPARAGLFMLAREGGDAAELEPVLALARADRIIRCGSATGDLATADLDPARRSEWTAEQWSRAEAAGVIVLAPPPEPEPDPATCQPVSTPAPAAPRNVDPLAAYDSPVWFDKDEHAWRTRFPPPADFDGDERGEWSDDGYHRDLTREELDALGLVQPGSAEDLAQMQAERERWFGQFAPEDEDEEEDEEAADEGDGDASPAEHPAPPPVDRALACNTGDHHGLQEA